MKSIFKFKTNNTSNIEDTQRIIDIMEKVYVATNSFERSAVCARDCLYQWQEGKLDETIDAWKTYISGKTVVEETRHCSLVPKINIETK